MDTDPDPVVDERSDRDLVYKVESASGSGMKIKIQIPLILNFLSVIIESMIKYQLYQLLYRKCELYYI